MADDDVIVDAAPQPIPAPETPPAGYMGSPAPVQDATAPPSAETLERARLTYREAREKLNDPAFPAWHQDRPKWVEKILAADATIRAAVPTPAAPTLEQQRATLTARVQLREEQKANVAAIHRTPEGSAEARDRIDLAIALANVQPSSAPVPGSFTNANIESALEAAGLDSTERTMFRVATERLGVNHLDRFQLANAIRDSRATADPDLPDEEILTRMHEWWGADYDRKSRAFLQVWNTKLTESERQGLLGFPGCRPFADRLAAIGLKLGR
jgi:hypothetical protein